MAPPACMCPSGVPQYWNTPVGWGVFPLECASGVAQWSAIPGPVGHRGAPYTRASVHSAYWGVPVAQRPVGGFHWSAPVAHVSESWNVMPVLRPMWAFHLMHNHSYAAQAQGGPLGGAYWSTPVSRACVRTRGTQARVRGTEGMPATGLLQSLTPPLLTRR